jgi:hypothetical protein
MRVLILASSLKFSKEEFDANEINKIFNKWEVDRTSLVIVPFITVDRDEFIKKISQAQAYLKSAGVRLTGDVYLYNTDEGKSQKLKIYAQKEYTLEECEFKIVCKHKRDETPAEKLEEDAKLDLFKQFVKTQRRRPEKNDKQDGFRVGDYYSRHGKMSEQFNKMEEIVEELTGNE